MIGNKSLTKANIFDAGTRSPENLRREWDDPETGERVYEKRSYMPCEKWVHRSGTVAHVPMGTGSMTGRVPQYAERTSEIMRRSGSIPYGKCPLATGDLVEKFFPEDMRNQCRRSDGYGEHKACPHVEYAISKWQTGQKRKAEKSERKHLGIAAKQVAAQQTQADAIMELARAAVANVNAAAPAPQPANTNAPSLARTLSAATPEFSEDVDMDDDFDLSDGEDE